MPVIALKTTGGRVWGGGSPLPRIKIVLIITTFSVPAVYSLRTVVLPASCYLASPPPQNKIYYSNYNNISSAGSIFAKDGRVTGIVLSGIAPPQNKNYYSNYNNISSAGSIFAKDGRVTGIVLSGIVLPLLATLTPSPLALPKSYSFSSYFISGVFLLM